MAPLLDRGLPIDGRNQAAMSLFIATLVHTPRLGTLEILEDQLVAVDDSGYILHFESSSSSWAQRTVEESSAAPTIIPKGSVLLPGFVDLHIHAPQYLYLGTGLHLPLMQWLVDYAYKAEQRLDSDPALARRVYTALVDRLIKNGTSAILAFGTIKEETNMVLASCLHERGLRGYVGKLSMDQSAVPSYVEKSSHDALSAAKSFIHHCRERFHDESSMKTNLIEPVITPRFAPTCSDELLIGLGDLAVSEGVRLQSHLAESRDEVNLVRSSRGEEDIDLMDRTGMLGVPNMVVQAHCTYLDPPHFERLRQRGTGIAHCPLSNAYFSAKPFRLREALDAGLKVGLGTDVAGGYSLDIMSSMRSAVMVSRMREGTRLEESLARQTSRPLSAEHHEVERTPPHSLAIDWKDSLYLGTKGGAEALGLPAGHFAVGQSFDVQLINLIDSQGKGVGAIEFFDSEVLINDDAIEKWWCIGDERNRGGMWVQGKRLV